MPKSLLIQEAQPESSIVSAQQHAPGVDDCAAVALPSIVVACSSRVASLERALHEMCFDMAPEASPTDMDVLLPFGSRALPIPVAHTVVCVCSYFHFQGSVPI